MLTLENSIPRAKQKFLATKLMPYPLFFNTFTFHNKIANKISFLRNHHQMRNQFGPFFLYVTFFSVFRLKLETLHVPTQPLLPESSLKGPFQTKISFIPTPKPNHLKLPNLGFTHYLPPNKTTYDPCTPSFTQTIRTPTRISQSQHSC